MEEFRVELRARALGKEGSNSVISSLSREGKDTDFRSRLSCEKLSWAHVVGRVELEEWDEPVKSPCRGREGLQG